MAIIIFIQGACPSMKRIVAIFFCIMLMAGLILAGKALSPSYHTEYLRIHIRANSNSFEDQSVKYKVKDAIVEKLTPIISSCKSKEEFTRAMQNNLGYIECIANQILAQNTINYQSKATLANEFFPTRTYDGVTLESGYYDAIIVNLGSGEGDNWWCVVYPPLCFLNSSSGYIYKSRLVEIINKFFGG